VSLAPIPLLGLRRVFPAFSANVAHWIYLTTLWLRIPLKTILVIRVKVNICADVIYA
jgi:hypothetical protein